MPGLWQPPAGGKGWGDAKSHLWVCGVPGGSAAPPKKIPRSWNLAPGGAAVPCGIGGTSVPQAVAEDNPKGSQIPVKAVSGLHSRAQKAGSILCAPGKHRPVLLSLPNGNFTLGKKSPERQVSAGSPSPAPRISSPSASTRNRISAGGSLSQPEHRTGITGRGTKAARHWGWQ